MCDYRPERSAVESRLDDMLIDIIVERKRFYISRMERALDKLEAYGYNIRIYRIIFEELKEEIM